MTTNLVLKSDDGGTEESKQTTPKKLNENVQALLNASNSVYDVEVVKKLVPDTDDYQHGEAAIGANILDELNQISYKTVILGGGGAGFNYRFLMNKVQRKKPPPTNKGKRGKTITKRISSYFQTKGLPGNATPTAKCCSHQRG